MPQQIYRKEKIKEKKEKSNLYSINMEHIKKKIDSLSRGLNASKLPIRSVDDFVSVCQKYDIPVNLKSMKVEHIDDIFARIKIQAAKNVLVNKKKKNKDDLYSLLLAGTSSINVATVLPNGGYNRTMMEKDETTWVSILAPFEKTKKRFIKSLSKKEAIFLVQMVLNKDKWIRKPSDFVFKSKNLNSLIGDYVSFVLFEYPTTKNEQMLFLSERTMNSFIENKSFHKTMKEINNSFILTKKQINRLIDYKPFLQHDDISSLKKEFFIFDIINDKKVTSDLLGEVYSTSFVEYCHYVKNRIFNDAFFERNQVKPVYDYVKAKINEVAQKQREDRAAANDQSICYFYHLNHHEPYSLLEGMQGWHRTLHKTKNKTIQSWKKSDVILEFEDVKYRNIEKEEDKLKHQNISTTAIIEINTSAGLSEEGRNMRHCVSSYARSCVHGNTRIFSLRKKHFSSHFAKSFATIEVREESRIVQAKAVKNEALTTEDKNIVAKWASKNGLSWF